MYSYIVEANEYLNENVRGFNHCDYTGYRSVGNPDFIISLKNTNNNLYQWQLDSAVADLKKILLNDFPKVIETLNWHKATICVVPRAKATNFYSSNQLLFRDTVADVASKLPQLSNGVDLISRHTHTRTTHLQRYDTIGSMPYNGISKDTCFISDNVCGQNIILVDDIYTKSINIDEDLIQALLDQGANAVCLYTVAKTVKKYP